MLDSASLNIAAKIVAKVKGDDKPGLLKWWFVLMGDRNGNEIIMPSGRPLRYVLRYEAFKSPEEVIRHVIEHYCRGGIDPDNAVLPLEAWATGDEPGDRTRLREERGPRTMIPANYTEHGCIRQHAEIEAGLRPHTDILHPPIKFLEQPAIVPFGQRGLTPFRRIRR